jgi:acyl carrier protein
MSNVYAVVVQCIKAAFPAYTGPVTNETSAKDVPGWDSFSHVNLIFDVEDELGCEFKVADTFALANVGELVSFIEEKVNER